MIFFKRIQNTSKFTMQSDEIITQIDFFIRTFSTQR